jgi:hypothetical protein
LATGEISEWQWVDAQGFARDLIDCAYDIQILVAAELKKYQWPELL